MRGFLLGLLILASASGLRAAPLSPCESQADCGPGHYCQGFLCQPPPIVGDEGPLFGLAVPPLRAPGGPPDFLLASEATRRLRASLAAGGAFRVLSQRAVGDRPLAPEAPTPAGLDARGWHRAGAWAVLLGAIWATQGGEVVLELRLIEIESGRSVPLASARQSFPREALPEALERVTSELLQRYTGRPGLFGTRIAYTRKVAGAKEIFSVDLGGEEELQHTHDGAISLLPAWSPDGEIAFTSYRDGNPDLWVGARKVSSRPDLNSGAAFSPDGRTIALTLALEGNPDIYLIDRETGGVRRRLTDHPAIDTSPTWSPDGRRLAFVSDRTGTPQIYVMDADGGRVRALTFEGYNTNPSWSPTRDRVVFDRLSTAERSDIFVVDVDTGSIQRLTHNRWSSEDPYYSPDGRQIVFKCTKDGTEQLYLMSADGSYVRRLTRGEGPYGSPSWSRPLAP